MKIYVNWEWEKIVKTIAEAIDFIVAAHECYTFSDYLTYELDLTIEEVFNLSEDKRAEISCEYAEYLEKAIKDYWEIIEI